MMQKVKSVLLTIAIICIGVSVMGWVTLNLLLKPSPTTESPELVAAKTQAQLAELARQQASNAWWGGFWQVGSYHYATGPINRDRHIYANCVA
jgi:hypothetical protein